MAASFKMSPYDFDTFTKPFVIVRFTYGNLNMKNLIFWWNVFTHRLIRLNASFSGLFTGASLDEGTKKMFYLTTHLTGFIYGYMASDIW